MKIKGPNQDSKRGPGTPMLGGGGGGNYNFNNNLFLILHR